MPRWSVGSLCGRRLAQPGDNGGDQGEREYQLGGTDDVNVFVMRTRSNIYRVTQHSGWLQRWGSKGGTRGS